MATVKKGVLITSGNWWKHLRFTKRTFWKGERQAGKGETKHEMEDADAQAEGSEPK
jgi:hypothetical protein